MTPNLDAMDADELWALWAKHQRPRRRFAAELFPTQPKGYVRAAQDVAAYASNKSTAIRCRLAGDIQAAQIYEAICEKIFASLPSFARW